MRKLLFAISIFLTACGSSEKSSPTLETQSRGEQLAQAYCASCHQLPQATDLDKNTWEKYILPRMGYMMGIYPDDSTRKSLLEAGLAGQIVSQSNVFPESPTLQQADWEKIRQYYLQNAPESLDAPDTLPIKQGLAHFKLKTPSFKLSPPSTTMIKIDAEEGIFIGDAFTESLYKFDKELNLLKIGKAKEGIVNFLNAEDAYWLTVMGSFSPTDQPSGFLMLLPKKEGLSPKRVINNLQRPVHTSFADINQDGAFDLVTCEFGKWTGRLSWWQNTPDRGLVQHVLRNKPGATNTRVVDLNGDQKLDILALMGQGDEGIFAYYQETDTSFREEALYHFPPSYGSSFFDTLDYNKDGHIDLIYTCGDNADYIPIVKPYHGIRILLNDGSGKFSQHLHLPLPGAYKAIPADFDQDGDIDIAAISFFPDFQNQIAQGFVYYEQTEPDTFEAYSFAEVDQGRWLVMDSGDLDQDGDIDLALGSLVFEVVPEMGLVDQWTEQGLPFVVLENTIR